MEHDLFQGNMLVVRFPVGQVRAVQACDIHGLGRHALAEGLIAVNRDVQPGGLFVEQKLDGGAQLAVYLEPGQLVVQAQPAGQTATGQLDAGRLLGQGIGLLALTLQRRQHQLVFGCVVPILSGRQYHQKMFGFGHALRQGFRMLRDLGQWR